MSYYGTINGAAAYFEARLHSPAWIESAIADRPKALAQATEIIDALNFKGYKAAVYAVLLANPAATTAQVYAAEASQELEFPRDADTVVPTAIERACYEIAYSRLDGRDPELELEAQAITSTRYGPVSTNYERSMSPIEHLQHGVPSMVAWRILKPFLRDANEVHLSRVS